MTVCTDRSNKKIVERTNQRRRMHRDSRKDCKRTKKDVGGQDMEGNGNTAVRFY